MPRRSSALAIVDTSELTPARWCDVETLFGPRGASSGCWCMYWRIADPAEYRAVQGRTAQRRFHELVENRRAHGVLAYASDQPVGWCAFERRVDLPRLDRAAYVRCDDADQVWSLPCFFVHRNHRGRGVGHALLEAALAALARRGARIVEAYPVEPGARDRIAPPAAYTGVPAMFEAAGFRRVSPPRRGKQRYRIELGRRSRR